MPLRKSGYKVCWVRLQELSTLKQGKERGMARGAEANNRKLNYGSIIVPGQRHHSDRFVRRSG